MDLREKLLNSGKVSIEIIEIDLDGEKTKIGLRKPTFKQRNSAVMNAGADDTMEDVAIKLLVENIVDPKTNKQLFDNSFIETLSNMSCDSWFSGLVLKISNYISLSTETKAEVEKN